MATNQRRSSKGSAWAASPALIAGTALMRCRDCGELVFAPLDGKMERTKRCAPCRKAMTPQGRR